MSDQDKKLPKEKEEDQEGENPPKKKEEKPKTYTSTMSFGKALDKMVKKKKVAEDEKDCKKED